VIELLVVPLLAPFAAPLLTRRLVGRLDPTAALWALTAATVVLAVSSLASLGGLLLSGALKLPAVARLGSLIHPLHVGPTAFLLPATLLSAGALAACAVTACCSVLRQWRLLRVARVEADTRHAAGDLSIVDDDRPDAYALPGNPGRIVVTSGMLRSLEPREREALFAHERAHLSGRHHLFLVAAELSAHCHPGLRPLRGDIALAVERAADEAAAGVTGDRRLTAQAIGRAALASRAARESRPAFVPSAVSGPVPQRVAALLHRPSGPRRLVAAFALLLLLCAGVSSATAMAGDVSLHSGVEVAQGEAPAPH
jgi:Zn-dependent protease with chaperone function